MKYEGWTIEKEMFFCEGCKEEKPTNTEGCTTGYGTDPETGHKYCFECCGKRDKESMIKDGRITLYLTTKPGIKNNNGSFVGRLPSSLLASEHVLTNWPGTLTFDPHYIKKGRHNIAGTRYDVWFSGPDGFIWHAVQYGEWTQIAHCRRTKQVTF